MELTKAGGTLFYHNTQGANENNEDS